MNLTKKSTGILLLTSLIVTLAMRDAFGTDVIESVQTISVASVAAPTYRLSPNDVLRVKVFQEDDLTTELRLGKDGSATFPLLGVIHLGGRTVDEAAATIRELLGKDYLVN